MNLYNFIPFFMICLSNATTYPGKRWIIICNNSKKWAENKTLPLKKYLQNNLDVLYSL